MLLCFERGQNTIFLDVFRRSHVLLRDREFNYHKRRSCQVEKKSKENWKDLRIGIVFYRIINLSFHVFVLLQYFKIHPRLNVDIIIDMML